MNTLKKHPNQKARTLPGAFTLGIRSLLIAASSLALTLPALAADPELITPSGAAVLRGDTLGGFEVVNLINGNGLSEAATLDNYLAVTHNSNGRWVTATAHFPTYYSGDFPAPILEFALDGVYGLTSMVVWGYAGNNNEGTDFHVEFSSDNGVTYETAADVASDHLLGTTSAQLDFGASFSANKVRITVVNNGGGRGFTGVGTGDRVGFGELRFIGAAEGGPITPPSIQIPPVAVTVLEGNAATFSVVAVGRAPLSYQWQFNQADIPSETSDTLTLPSVTSAQAGKYRVIVTNDGGSTASDEAVLTVIKPQVGIELITPSDISQLAGDALGGYAVVNLINDLGFGEPPNVDGYPLVTHGENGLWVTASAVFPDNYFAKGKTPPQFLLTLPGVYNVSDMVVWGYGGNNNEASDFIVELSADSGTSFGAPICVATTELLGNKSGRLSLGGVFPADAVRITMVNNAGGRGFTGVGPGDRVGLGEIKFIAALPLLITPKETTLVAGDALGGFEVVNLINEVGLSALPTLDTFAGVTQGDSGRWVTQTGTFPQNYFDAKAVAPILDFDLGALYSVSDLVLWGYGGNNNEGTDFEVQFSTDGGVTYSEQVSAASSKLLGTGVEAITFGGSHTADHVRIKITNNAGGRKFAGTGPGDRVGLGKVRFIGTPHPAFVAANLSLAQTEAGYELRYCNGILESATDVAGPWSAVDAAASPYVLSLDEAHRFFRVR